MYWRSLGAGSPGKCFYLSNCRFAKRQLAEVRLDDRLPKPTTRAQLVEDLIAFDIIKGVPYIATRPAGCIAYNKWQRPRSASSAFQVRKPTVDTHWSRRISYEKSRKRM